MKVAELAKAFAKMVEDGLGDFEVVRPQSSGGEPDFDWRQPTIRRAGQVTLYDYKSHTPIQCVIIDENWNQWHTEAYWDMYYKDLNPFKGFVWKEKKKEEPTWDI
jgi:hypothetical protein